MEQLDSNTALALFFVALACLIIILMVGAGGDDD